MRFSDSRTKPEHRSRHLRATVLEDHSLHLFAVVFTVMFQPSDPGLEEGEAGRRRPQRGDRGPRRARERLFRRNGNDALPGHEATPATKNLQRPGNRRPGITAPRARDRMMIGMGRQNHPPFSISRPPLVRTTLRRVLPCTS